MTRTKLSHAMANLCIQLIFFIFLFFISALAQNNGIVPLGRSLTAGETSNSWLSPSGDFAFGFQKIPDKDLYLFSIWYNNIPDKTVVWYANPTNTVPRGSTVALDAQTGLVFRDPQGLQLWSADVNPNQVDHGFMNDTGNFILKGSDESWLWESFKHPADTILPNQELEINGTLSSRQSATNFSQGRFYLHFQGAVVLTTSRNVLISDDGVYYPNTANWSNDGYKVIFDSGGTMYIRKVNNQTEQLSPSRLGSENYYHRATLDFDGLFTHYYHPRNSTSNSNWTILWSVPDNICLTIKYKGVIACGYNNVCMLENGRPVCKCPKGYVLRDPNNMYGDCKANSLVSCGGVEGDSVENLYDFEVMNDTDWPMNDFYQISPSSETICKLSCLQNCLCAVAIFRVNSCWMLKLPLINGRVDYRLQSKAFIKYHKSDAPPAYPIVPQGYPVESKSKDRGTLILVGSVLLGSSFLVNLTFITAACLGVYLIYQKKKVIFHLNTDAKDINLHIFPYKELAEATDGFKEELGRGSFGIVYKGELQISSKGSIIAVKKLDRVAKDAEKEFRAEVKTIGQTNHKNLVRLLGFCDEGQHRLLVYEYMSHGTLARLLLHDPKPSWNLRTQIAIGIARGLVYLHEECRTQIIHCDIKPQNVLLDEYFNARISDFGLAKLLMISQSQTMTSIRGTKGYVAPEWFRNNQINAKVDVYSFGVLLLEIISCRKCVEDIENIGEGENPILTDWAWDCFQEGRLDKFVDNDLEALEDKMMLKRFLMVAIWCIQENPSLRPKMRKVSQMLDGIVEVMVPPCPSPFCSTS
ncbi:G-type lectin S-receptor-like serine/threonine-protein kinase RLK1 [Coffea arabica]|uniref:Receptor-like serine/threonine-protein kinase n=1 Tax=Coffea arabica TaxID=13443 RepID=A0A6P6THA6_COFAR